MAKQRILVIEDDAAIRRGIVDSLRFHGYDIWEAANGKEGLRMAVSVDCDLILLDLVLPKGDGLEILRQVRVTRPTLAVIILTAKGTEDDRVKGLQVGADDYVVKPFSVKELLARVGAVLRRSPERPSDVAAIHFLDGVIDLARFEVRFKSGKTAALSEREVEILRYLASNRGRIISRQELLSRVWRLDPKGIETRTVDMHIVRLREKLGDDPDRPRVILTVRGKGYMMAARKERG